MFTTKQLNFKNDIAESSLSKYEITYRIPFVSNTYTLLTQVLAGLFFISSHLLRAERVRARVPAFAATFYRNSKPRTNLIEFCL